MLGRKSKLFNLENELKELSTLEEDIIKYSVELMSGCKAAIKIIINKSLFDANLIKKDKEIIFLLIIRNNHPFAPPKLYCISKFCTPELSDGRDYIEDVLMKNWSPKKNNTIKKIISLIPNFISNYLDEVCSQKKYKILGKYYLDDYYDQGILNQFPHLYFDNIIEIVALNNDKRVDDEKRIIMITESFLLLFVQKNMFEPNKLKLIFCGSIHSLSLIKQLSSRNVIELKWKVKWDNIFLMRLKTEKYEKIVQILMDCLSKKNISYRISNESSGEKKRRTSKN